MSRPKPSKLTIRAYGVGFGDCFLLTFHYAGSSGDRHMLIDFGSTERPPKAVKNLPVAIANDIRTVCGDKLHVVVATHRHKDHISGFDPGKSGKGPGSIIKSLKPSLVIQPWTEKPDAPRSWKGPGSTGGNQLAAMVMALDSMNRFAAAILQEARYLDANLAAIVKSVGEEGLKNLAAVKNLRAMGKNVYVHHGKKVPRLGQLLPGVEIKILGPPTIRQKQDIVRETSKHEEFWHFASFWRLHAASADLAEGAMDSLFPAAKHVKRSASPMEARWFIKQMRSLRGEQLLHLVREMDNALNNTSVILLMKAGTKKLLFPGDAQWENWEFALQKDGDQLKDVDVYKVGHHGSLNATPKSLWRLFKNKSRTVGKSGRLTTLMSTVTDSKHGSEENESEVPRGKLVKELVRNSRLISTQELEAQGGLRIVEEIDL